MNGAADVHGLILTSNPAIVEPVTLLDFKSAHKVVYSLINMSMCASK